MFPPNSVILSHSGKQHAYYVARALNDIGYLKQFYTSAYVSSRHLQQLLVRFNDNFFQRRFLDGLYGSRINTSWRYELNELLARKIWGNNGRVKKLVLKRDINFDLGLSTKLQRLDYKVFWGFQGSCLQSLKTAKQTWHYAICEMSTAHISIANKILQEEASLLPAWADSIDYFSFPEYYEERLVNEPLSANRVIALSSFLKTTLVEAGVPATNINVIPLGFDDSRVTFGPGTDITRRPLKLLFAGRITARKGVYYLLQAIQRFRKQDVELHFIGNIIGSGNAFKSFSNLYTYTRGVSQNEMYNLYGNYDVLVFPSLVEGFGLVALEAMGAGLPVIMTPNTSAAEILEDGSNGYLVPVRDVDALVGAIEKFRNMDNGKFQNMRLAARKKAEQFTWSKYQGRVEDFVKNLPETW